MIHAKKQDYKFVLMPRYAVFTDNELFAFANSPRGALEAVREAHSQVDTEEVIVWGRDASADAELREITERK